MKFQKIMKYILIGAAVLFYLFAGISKSGLFDDDEAYYSEVAREMLETGNYAVPHFNYLPFLHKPALYYWFVSLSYKVFGINEFAARLPSVIFILTLLVIIYYFVSRLFNRTTAIMAGVILIANIEMMVISKAATMDALLMLLISASLFCYLEAYFSENKRYYIGVYIFSALAVLTKGPSGLIIPGLVIFLFLAFSRQLSKYKEMDLLKGAIIFLVISLPWYVLVTVLTKGDFAKDFFLYHNIARFSSSFEGHSGNLFYYAVVILFGFYPWSSFLPSSIFRSIKRDKKLFFILLWAAVPFVFFTLARTKLPNYIVPSFVPISILTANWWNEYKNNDKNFKIDINISLVILFIVALIFCVVFGLNEQLINMAKSNFDNPFLMHDISFGIAPVILSIFLILLILSSYFCFKYGLKTCSFVAIALIMFCFNFVMVEYVMPKGWFYVQGGLYELSNYVKNTRDDSVVVYALQQPSIVFYSQRKIKFISPEEDALFGFIIENHKIDGRKVYVITKKSLVDRLFPYGLSVVNNTGGYSLLSN
ncbi:MAG: glycosyltransferase family 39 protein [Elusimicrobia bacterium]|nr:glycosyltransferase family 39 protein [Elusimicrobiota bacterium]